MKRTRNKKPTFNVLCLDPSLKAFGLAVVSLPKEKVRHGECIKTENNSNKLRIRKGDDRMRRVAEIMNRVKDIIDEYSINYIVSELPHGSQSAVAATALGLVSGAVQSMAIALDLGLEWYSEADCKKALLGKNSATKIETVNKIKIKYEVSWPKAMYKQEAIADSLAVYYVAQRNSHVIKAMKL